MDVLRRAIYLINGGARPYRWILAGELRTAAFYECLRVFRAEIVLATEALAVLQIGSSHVRHHEALHFSSVRRQRDAHALLFDLVAR